VAEVRAKGSVTSKDIAEPVMLPDKGIWHPVADKVYESADEYFAWYNSAHAPAAGIAPGAPTVGLVLQKSHINTKDECHYIAMVAELEARGARVVTLYR
jgi:magnesium chelatase subunit H